MQTLLLDAAGRRRSPATLPGYHRGRSPRNKGLRYPADPPTVEEIVAVMRAAGGTLDGLRLRALARRSVASWLAHRRGSRSHVSRRRTSTRGAARSSSATAKAASVARSGWDVWAWEQLAPWLDARAAMPVGTLFCIIHGRTAGALGPRPQFGRNSAACGRDGARRRPTDRDPATTGPHEPRDHFDLPPRHRQHRDDRHRPCPPSPNDPGDRGASAQRGMEAVGGAVGGAARLRRRRSARVRGRL